MRSPLPDLETMTRSLVSRPSVSSVHTHLDSPNTAVCELLAQWLEDLGFEASLQPVPGHPGKSNLIAASGPGEEGLVLAGHTDTVPCDVERWRTDPFAGTVTEDRLHGLGATDMKGFFAAALHAISRVDPARLRRPVVLLATADEESGMHGARALVEAESRPGARAVIGEPTGLAPVTLHKGIFMEAIRLTGRSGHSSDPSLGVSALEGMAEVIDELRRWRSELTGRWRDPAFEVPSPTLNLGRIEGGDNPNRICAECELAIDMRLLPGMTVTDMRAELRERVAARIAGSGLELRFRKLFDGVDPLRAADDSDHVRQCRRHSGRDCEAVAFCTEAPLFQEMGMDTVVMGPGDIRLAHQPNEWVALSELSRCADLLEALIADHCLDEPA